MSSRFLSLKKQGVDTNQGKGAHYVASGFVGLGSLNLRAGYWVAVKEVRLSDHISESILCTVYPYYCSLN